MAIESEMEALFISIGLEKYLKRLEDEDICDFETLSSLSESDFRELGFSIGHRKKLVASLLAYSSAPNGPQIPSEFSDIIISYPTPIAKPIDLMFSKTDVEASLKALIDAVTHLLKFQAMVVQSDYLQAKFSDATVNETIRNDLSRPLISAWAKFVEVALPAFKDNKSDLFVPELTACYEKAETKRKENQKIRVPGKGYYNEDGDFVETTSKLGLVRSLISFRNKRAHGYSQRESESLAEYTFYLSVFLKLLKELSWLGKYKLYKREHQVVWDLTGSNPVQSEFQWPRNATNSGLILVSPDSNHLSLFPLFIVPTDYISDSGQDETLLIYEQDTGKRLIYVSPEGAHFETNATVQTWRKLLNQKEIFHEHLSAKEITTEKLFARARMISRDTEIGLESSQKIFKNLYVNREQIEQAFELFPKSVFPISVIEAKGGAGKTSLLHYLSQKWLKKEIPTIFVRAINIDIPEFDAWLIRELGLDPALTMSKLADILSDQDITLIVIIDGLNENANRSEILNSLIDIAKLSASKSTKIKVLLSWRDEDTEWSSELGSRNGELLFRSVDGADSDTREATHKLKNLEPSEIEQLWNKLIKVNNSKYRPDFTLAELREKRNSIFHLLSSPLFMRLFLEVYGRESLKNLPSTLDMMVKWIERTGKSTADDNSFLFDVVSIFLQQKSLSIDLDLLYDNLKTQPVVMRTDVLSPFNRLTRKLGVLLVSGGAKPQVSFTMDRYYEFTAASYLLLSNKVNTPQEFLAVSKQLRGNPLANQIIEQLLFILTLEKGSQVIWELIDIPDFDGYGRAMENIIANVISQFIVYNENTVEIVDLLTASLTDNDFVIAESMIRNLAYRENRISLAQEVASAISQRLPRKGPITRAEFLLRQTVLDLAIRTTAKEEHIRDLVIPEDRILTENHFINLGRRADQALSQSKIFEFHSQLFASINQYEAAVEWAIRGLQYWKEISKEDSHQALSALSKLASIHTKFEQFDEAAKVYKRMLSLNPKAGLNRFTQLRLGQNYLKAKQYQHAFKHLKKYISDSESLSVGIPLSKRFPYIQLPIGYQTLSDAYRKNGQLDFALEYSLKSVEMKKALWGLEDPTTSRSMISLAKVLSLMNDKERALEVSGQILKINLNWFGQKHYSVADSYLLRARIFSRFNDFSESSEQFKLSIQSSIGSLHKDLPVIRLEYANFLIQHEKIEEASTQLKNAKKEFTDAGDDIHVQEICELEKKIRLST